MKELRYSLVLTSTIIGLESCSPTLQKTTVFCPLGKLEPKQNGNIIHALVVMTELACEKILAPQNLIGYLPQF